MIQNNRKMNLLACVSLVLVLIFVDRRRTLWRHALAGIERQLLQPVPKKQQIQQWNDLPQIVQKYLTRTFSSTTQLPFAVDDDLWARRKVQLQEQGPEMLQSVKFRQTGQFSWSKEQDWITFEARQLLTQAGFMWNAQIPLIDVSVWELLAPAYFPISLVSGLIKNLVTADVCDSIILDNNGNLQANLLAGLVNLVNSKDLPQDDLWLGEALRWLPEAVLLPTVLLPQAGFVTWKDMPTRSDQAVLELVMPPSRAGQTPVSVVATFDPVEGWMTQVEAVRPKINSASDVEMGSWIGVLSRYEWVDDNVWVPTHMEAGWTEHGDSSEKDVILYFRGDNHNLQYT